MFGFVSKKKLVKEMVSIYLLNDTDNVSGDNANERIMWFNFNNGNANALNALAGRLGINLTEYVRAEKQKRGE